MLRKSHEKAQCSINKLELAANSFLVVINEVKEIGIAASVSVHDFFLVTKVFKTH